MNLKRMVLTFGIAMLLAVGAISVGTALTITQPVNATIKIEGLGSSPSFNIMDNVFDAGTNAKTGAAAGYIDSNDNYVIAFGATSPGGNWQLSLGRSQTADVGNKTDYVFKLQNNYANSMSIKLEKVGGDLGANTVIKIMDTNDTDDLTDDTAQWTLTGGTAGASYQDWTCSADTLALASAASKTFRLRVENSNATARTSSPTLKFTVTAD